MSPSTSSTDGTAPEPLVLEVGRITKPHGVRGDVIVALSTNRSERMEPGTHLRTHRGRSLHITASRPHHDRWIVTFEGIGDREAADHLRGTVLLAEPLEDTDELWVHELVGAAVIDAAGVERGTVTAVQENPAADLLVLDSGALVPVVFVVDRRPGQVIVDVPEGLFEL